MNSTKDLQKHKKENDFQLFYKKLEPYVPELRSFIAGSLKAAEQQGTIDRGFYNSDDLLDEIFLELFQASSYETDTIKLKRLLFHKALQKINLKQAQDVPDEITTHGLLKAELKALSEDFTAEGDGDRILFDELDDISYGQKQGWSKEIYLDESLEKLLVAKLNLQEASLLSDEKRRLLGGLYNTIPPRSKQVIELFVFGNQDPQEISEIIEVPEEMIQRIIFKVKERFRLI